MSTHELTLQSLKDVLGFPFRGAGWQNRLLIGFGLALAGLIVPIAPLIFLMGYSARLMRQALHGETLELPAWEDWDRLGLDGLRVFSVSLVYLLPHYLVMIGGMGAYFAGAFGMVALLSSERLEQAQLAATLAPAAMLILVGIMFLSIFLGYLLLFLGAVPLPVALARCIEQEKFGAAFHWRAIHKTLWRNKSDYLVAWIILVGLLGIAYFVAMMFYTTMLLSWVVLVLMLPFGFYMMMIAAVLFGQIYRQSIETLSQEETPPEQEGIAVVTPLDLAD